MTGRVEPPRSGTRPARSEIGSFRPYLRAQTKVSSLIPGKRLSARSANWSSCPEASFLMRRNELFDDLVGRSEQHCGTVRLGALAVLRLIASSNFVGCRTGMSVGGTVQDLVGAMDHVADRRGTARSIPGEGSRFPPLPARRRLPASRGGSAVKRSSHAGRRG